MVNVEMLKRKMKDKKITVNEMSKEIGVNPSTLYRKLSAAEKITIKEAVKIAEILELTVADTEEIFFA